MSKKLNIIPMILLAMLCAAEIYAAEPQSDDDYVVVRDTIRYTTRPRLDTSDPMKYVANNPPTAPKGSGGLSHIKTSTNNQSITDKDSEQQAQQVIAQKTTNVYHTVRSGETLGKIAAKYHVSVNSIVKLNKLKSANVISVGQKLRIK